MWEEHPAYQKLQAAMVGLLVLVLFIGGVLYCTSTGDWDSLRLVIYAAAGLVVALAIFPLAAWVIVKAVARRRASPPKLRQEP